MIFSATRPSRRAGLDLRRPAADPAAHRDPEADDRDRRLVLVLLEEHPLQDLGALVGVSGR